MIVVDTNILAYLYFESPFSDAAANLFEEDSKWCAPLLWRSEFTNILAGKLRRSELTLDQACAVQERAEDLLEGAELPVSTRKVLHLVSRSDCSAYDCEFVALALDLGCLLYTMDARILRVFPALAKSLPVH